MRVKKNSLMGTVKTKVWFKNSKYKGNPKKTVVVVRYNEKKLTANPVIYVKSQQEARNYIKKKGGIYKNWGA